MKTSKRWVEFIKWWECKKHQFWKDSDSRHIIIEIDMAIEAIKLGKLKRGKK